jgi:hypothetical protein
MASIIASGRNYCKILTDFVIPDGEADPESMPHYCRAEPLQNGAPQPVGAVIAADYDRLNQSLPAICQRLDERALEFKDFTWAVADFLAAGDGGSGGGVGIKCTVTVILSKTAAPMTASPQPCCA